MQRSPRLNRFGVFGNLENEEVNTSKQLEYALSVAREFIVAYEPYLKQVKLDRVLAKDNLLAEALIQDYIEKCDINASNNLGVTLLHALIWAERPDLAKRVIESPNFKKINFKFCIPFEMGTMYASALDLAIGLWRSKESTISLEFLESLLIHGAVPPKPDKKFLSGEFVSEIYPLIIFEGVDHPDMIGFRTQDEIKDLFCLLYRYEFSIEEMERELCRRLFDTEDVSNNRAEEFSRKYEIDTEKQKSLLTGFMLKLNAACKDLQKGKPIVELDDERLENGEKTLTLPFNPHDRPCCIM